MAARSGRGGRGTKVAKSKAAKMMHSKSRAIRSIGATYLGSNNSR